MGKYEILKKYQSVVNGYVDMGNSGKNPTQRIEVKYFNPVKKNNDGTVGGMQVQNCLDMDDIIVPVLIKKSDNGELEFALQYEYIPATKKVQLELPDIPIKEKKPQYGNKVIMETIDENLRGKGIVVNGIKYLDSYETPVSQSFTNQRAKFVALYVEEKENNDYKLQWYPMSTLGSYLDKIGINSSLQTQYALQLLYQDKAFERDIKVDEHEFFVDESILKDVSEWEDKRTLMEHKYRFGVELQENERETQDEVVQEFGNVAEYGKSKNSVQCLLLKKDEDKYLVGVAKQQRSPFVIVDGIDEYFDEASAGMVEENEAYIDAAIRETREETGIEIKEDDMIEFGEILLSKATEEYSKFYLCILNDFTIGDKELDADENVGQLEWIDMDKINLGGSKMPLPTKYLITKAREYLSLEKKLTMEDSNFSR